jgi:sn-glycerol 3-phosphate transport system ATP-binding protein
VYHRPATTFVAGFIGSPPMNLVRGHASGSTFTAGGQQLPLASPAPRDGDLILGLRPEHMELGGGGGDTSWPVRVQALEMLGAERLVYGTLGDALFTARIDATMAAPRVDEVVNIRAAPGHLHWFDAASTARVGA